MVPWQLTQEFRGIHERKTLLIDDALVAANNCAKISIFPFHVGIHTYRESRPQSCEGDPDEPYRKFRI
jgi:hypothetical protein